MCAKRYIQPRRDYNRYTFCIRHEARKLPIPRYQIAAIVDNTTFILIHLNHRNYLATANKQPVNTFQAPTILQIRLFCDPVVWSFGTVRLPSVEATSLF